MRLDSYLTREVGVNIYRITTGPTPGSDQKRVLSKELECSNGKMISAFQDNNVMNIAYTHANSNKEIVVNANDVEVKAVVSDQARILTLEQCESVFETLLDYEITKVREWTGFLNAFTKKHGVLFAPMIPSDVLKSKETTFCNDERGWRVDFLKAEKDDYDNIDQANDALARIYKDYARKIYNTMGKIPLWSVEEDRHDTEPVVGQCCNSAGRRQYGPCRECGRS